MEGGLSSRMWRRHGTGVLVVGGVCGLGWVQRERLFRAWRMVCALFRTGYYTSLMMERLSEDMYRYLYPEETGDTSTELPGSVKRVLTLLTSTQVVEAFGVLVRAGAEGVIQKMPADPTRLQKLLGTPECERFAMVIIRTATREVLRSYMSNMEERRQESGGEGDSPFCLTPDVVGEWLKNDRIRALVVEAISSIVIHASRQGGKREPQFSTTKCGVGRRNSTKLNAITTSSRDLRVGVANAVAQDRRNEPDFAEKLVMTAMKDKDLMRAVASESVRSYLTTRSELEKGTLRPRSISAAATTENTSVSETLAVGDTRGNSDAVSSTGPGASSSKPSTVWWLTKAIARGSWNMLSSRPSAPL